jgi:hypothetical protein
MKITNNGGEFLIRYEPTSTIFSKDETKALDFTEQEVYRIFKEQLKVKRYLFSRLDSGKPISNLSL